jgi:hypothetical protein
MDLTALKNQGAGLARGGIWFAAGWVVGKGLLDGDTAIAIGGALLTVIGGGLTALANTNGSITAAFSAMETTKKIEISDPKLAEIAKKADPETVVVVKPPPKEET